MADEDALPPAGEGVSVPTGLEGSEGIICVKGHTAFFSLCLWGDCVGTRMCSCICACMCRSQVNLRAIHLAF